MQLDNTEMLTAGSRYSPWGWQTKGRLECQNPEPWKRGLLGAGTQTFEWAMPSICGDIRRLVLGVYV